MSGKDIIIEQLRADVARLEAERDEWKAKHDDGFGGEIPF